MRADRIGVIGHSLGAMSALAVAALNPDHRAVNSQCGPAGSLALHNVLLTQARYDHDAAVPAGGAPGRRRPRLGAAPSLSPL
ncbi:MAG: hypothetical protein ACM3NQ_07760 [Bacteroidales bacterium]